VRKTYHVAAIVSYFICGCLGFSFLLVATAIPAGLLPLFGLVWHFFMDVLRRRFVCE